MGFELIWESRCLLRRFHGRVTGADVVASLCEASADPRLDSLTACVADYSTAESLDIADGDAAMIAALHIGARCTVPALVTVGVAQDPGVIATIRRVEAAFQPGLQVTLVADLGAARRQIAEAEDRVGHRRHGP